MSKPPIQEVRIRGLSSAVFGGNIATVLFLGVCYVGFLYLRGVDESRARNLAAAATPAPSPYLFWVTTTRQVRSRNGVAVDTGSKLGVLARELGAYVVTLNGARDSVPSDAAVAD